MIDLNNIRNFTISRPEFNFIGTAKDFDALPETHREQILFVDKTAEKYIFDFVSAANLITDGFWDPFSKGNFKTVEESEALSNTPVANQELKKWLFNRGIAFPTWVFVLMETPGPPMLMTWKMVIKYVDHILFGSDVVIFDSTLNWCLVYFHENQLFFGKDRFYDPSENEQMMKDLNEKKKKYPQFRHPFL
jgi:hypothetical protein